MHIYYPSATHSLMHGDGTCVVSFVLPSRLLVQPLTICQSPPRLSKRSYSQKALEECQAMKITMAPRGLSGIHHSVATDT